MRFVLCAVLVAGAWCFVIAAPTIRQDGTTVSAPNDATATVDAPTTPTDASAPTTPTDPTIPVTPVDEPTPLDEPNTPTEPQNPIDPLPEPTCVNNATHCSCLGHVYYPVIMIPDTQPPVCYQDPLATKAYKCDCAGTALCEVEQFACTKLQALEEVVPNQKFYCEPTESECKKLTRVFTPIVYEEQKESKKSL
uniref:Uncharacterized protein n=1 Tax=Erythrolobus madagascarensis TaxID=708628 RepID=A0A7S0T710_9RHOD|mmetsp:Transcript_3504/g.7596  ORF Transcript_3504/g.7596 Transcript_3504/m.7596 type:complete len:194 (+) Transcript_3504:303-884(+)